MTTNPPARSNQQTVVAPSASSAARPLPPTSRGTQIELQQIPQVAQPHIQPVARTRSSR